MPIVGRCGMQVCSFPLLGLLQQELVLGLGRSNDSKSKLNLCVYLQWVWLVWFECPSKRLEKAAHLRNCFEYPPSVA